MLLDRDIDYVTAMVTSYQAVTSNLQPMLHWAWIVAAALVVAMLPMFLGLIVALPVLGHATWHLYRRVIAPAEPDAPAGATRAGRRAPARLPRLFGGGDRRRGGAGPARPAALAERVVLALHRALEMRAALDGDGLVDDVALAARRGATAAPSGRAAGRRPGRARRPRRRSPRP